MALIYHITTVEEWVAAKASGSYTAPSLASEGFIHCSKDERQTTGVLQRYFSGKTGLVKLIIDTDNLKSELHYELAPSVGEEFPHIYGPLNTDAIIGVETV
jgi:uncharacterized protein (DUF952 family)